MIYSTFCKCGNSISLELNVLILQDSDDDSIVAKLLFVDKENFTKAMTLVEKATDEFYGEVIDYSIYERVIELFDEEKIEFYPFDETIMEV